MVEHAGSGYVSCGARATLSGGIELYCELPLGHAEKLHSDHHGQMHIVWDESDLS